MASPLRIMHVVLSLEPGGMENGVVNVSRGLAEDGDFEMRVCCIERKGEFAARLPDVVSVDCLEKGPGFSVQAIWKLRKLIKTVRPAVVHTHGLGPLIYAGLAGLGTSTRILHGEHGQLQPRELGAIKILERKVFYRLCAQIHAVSEELLTDFAAHDFPFGKKGIAIANGVDCARFHPCDDKIRKRSQLGIPVDEGVRVLGLVGRFDPVKRPAMMIEAFDILAKEDLDLQLLVVGDGGEAKGEVMSLIEGSEYRGRIHRVGFQENTVPCYQGLDLLVLPSALEGMSNVMLEAMACGVPVFASRACGCAEIISEGEDGFLSDANDAQALATDLAVALQKGGDLGEMGRKGRKIIEDRYSLDVMVLRYAALYRDVSAG